MAETTFDFCELCRDREAKHVVDGEIKLCEKCYERISYDEGIYVIYWDGGNDDANHIYGYIKGTEIDALRCCKILCEIDDCDFDEIVYERMKNLNELITPKKD